MRTHLVIAAVGAVVLSSSAALAHKYPLEYWDELNALLAELYEHAEKEMGWIEGFLGDGALVQFNTFSEIAALPAAKSNFPQVFLSQVVPFLHDVQDLKKKLPPGTELRILGSYLHPSSSCVGIFSPVRTIRHSSHWACRTSRAGSEGAPCQTRTELATPRPA